MWASGKSTNNCMIFVSKLIDHCIRSYRMIFSIPVKVTVSSQWPMKEMQKLPLKTLTELPWTAKRSK